MTQIRDDARNIEVVRWISGADADKYPEAFGGLGGWFNFKQKGQRWKDYIENVKEEYHPYAEALRREILRRKLREGGDWHQHSEEGTPVFSDETVANFSYRAWGDLLAAVWSEEENRDYHYMNFYMTCLVHNPDE